MYIDDPSLLTLGTRLAHLMCVCVRTDHYLRPWSSPGRCPATADRGNWHHHHAHRAGIERESLPRVAVNRAVPCADERANEKETAERRVLFIKRAARRGGETSSDALAELFRIGCLSAVGARRARRALSFPVRLKLYPTHSQILVRTSESRARGDRLSLSLSLSLVFARLPNISAPARARAAERK